MLAFESVGDVLGQLRRRRGWSVASLARRSGVPPRILAGLEAGTLALDPELGGLLVRTLASDDPAMHAMAMLCCLTFQADMDRRRALNVLMTCGVAGYA
jgi:Helix-turn-helix